MSDLIKVMLPAGRVPLDTIVTKRTGQKEYTLRDEIRIYPINGTGSQAERDAVDPEAKVQVIKASPGTRFLVGDNGNANAIPTDLELIWVTTRDSLLRYLQYEEDK